MERRRMAWHGMALFLLGLITGLLEQYFHNPRMGLAAHLEGSSFAIPSVQSQTASPAGYTGRARAEKKADGKCREVLGGPPRTCLNIQVPRRA
jgi:hypothetical protein